LVQVPEPVSTVLAVGSRNPVVGTDTSSSAVVTVVIARINRVIAHAENRRAKVKIHIWAIGAALTDRSAAEVDVDS
jgi:hypothetical protein